MTELQNEAKENEKRQSEVTKEQKIQLQKLFQTLEEQKCEIGKCSTFFNSFSFFFVVNIRIYLFFSIIYYHYFFYEKIVFSNCESF